MALKLITPPAVTPISLAEARLHLRVDGTEEDSLIEGLIQAATQHIDGADGWLGRALVTQTWELQLDEFPRSAIEIPLPPLQSIVSVKYIDPDGVEQTLGTEGYAVDNVSVPGWIVPAAAGWPATMCTINAVKIRFVAGYAGDVNSSPVDLAAGVPAPIKAALKLLLGTWFSQRESVVIGQTPTEMPMAVQALLAPYKLWRF